MAAAGEAEASAGVAESIVAEASAGTSVSADVVVSEGFGVQAATDRAATATAAIRAVRTILEVMDQILVSNV